MVRFAVGRSDRAGASGLVLFWGKPQEVRSMDLKADIHDWEEIPGRLRSRCFSCFRKRRLFPKLVVTGFRTFGAKAC